MCGILAIYKSTCIDYNLFSRQLESVDYRGPDSTGIWKSDNDKCFLGSKRLSINDLTDSGKMPMTHDDTFTIVFNGEIYNHRLIKNKLIALGHTFNSNSDTECILKSYIEWGTSCLEYFEGMFAFVIYDKSKNQLFFARDIVGEKPLYYWKHKNGLSISSELKQLTIDNELERKLDLNALNSYLRNGYLLDSETLISNVFQLPKAHFAIFDISLNELILKQYWHIPKHENSSASLSSLTTELDLLLMESIKKQTECEVPFGVFLSGGVDSSLLTYYASKNSSEKIKTFHISFPGYEQLNESKYAKLVSEICGTDHFELDGGIINFKMIKELIKNFSDPIADSSILPTFLVSKLTSQKVKVAIGGDGGDELFGGYETYSRILKLNPIVKKIPKIFFSLIKLLARFLPLGFKGRNFLMTIEKTAQDSFLSNRLFDDFSIKKILKNKSLKSKDSKRFSSNDLIYFFTCNDFNNYLTSNILKKVDRCSMANSIEVRAPFLDKKIIEFAFRNVPSNFKANKNESKIILKELLKSKIGEKLNLNRKQGFSIPIHDWINNKWHADVKAELKKLPESLFNIDFVIKMLEDNKKGCSNSSRIFSLVVLSLWLNEYKIKV